MNWAIVMRKKCARYGWSLFHAQPNVVFINASPSWSSCASASYFLLGSCANKRKYIYHTLCCPHTKIFAFLLTIWWITSMNYMSFLTDYCGKSRPVRGPFLLLHTADPCRRTGAIALPSFQPVFWIQLIIRYKCRGSFPGLIKVALSKYLARAV